MAQAQFQSAAQKAGAAAPIPEGMQFRFNSDYPGPPPPAFGNAESLASEPDPFPTAQIDPCARITTRVYVPKRNQVVVVRDVLVGTLPPGAVASQGHQGHGQNGGGGGGGGGGDGGVAPARPGAGKKMSWADVDDDSDEDNSDDSWDDDSDSDMDEDAAVGNDDSGGGGGGGFNAVTAAPPPPPQPGRAYWLQRTLREAIYGRVKYAVVLKRRPLVSTLPQSLSAASPSPPAAEWEVTDEKCAVKEMSWNHIRRERDRLAEDPIKEVSAMQYLSRYHRRLRNEIRGGSVVDGTDAEGDCVSDPMMDTHIMMPLDLMSDDRYLYSIMPFCNGGELFDRLDERQKFSEEESRYWMHQILNGVENLQRAGVCHRDMSLENLLVHNDRLCLIIDMGMCLRIPYQTGSNGNGGVVAGGTPVDTVRMVNSFAGMSVDSDSRGLAAPSAVRYGTVRERIDQLDLRKGGKRFLIRPQGTCGKWHYMSPEIAQNRFPFDGHAVDMWATGVILFLMLTGFPPWERPCKSDDRFKYMTAGYLVQMLTEWELGLSPDAMDLLQRMLWLDPRDRLSLEQVRAHPWMMNGKRELPPQQRAGNFIAGGTRG